MAEDWVSKSGAKLSECRIYRYALWRHWDWQGQKNCVMFIGINPSTADETKDDTTITKCIGFAKRWGYGGLYMMNLYGYRSPYPHEMVRVDDPVGPGNDVTFWNYGKVVGLVVAAWGSSVSARHKSRMQYQSRINQVLACVARPVYCLGRTQDGSPRHPSRLGYNTERELFWRPANG